MTAHRTSTQGSDWLARYRSLVDVMDAIRRACPRVEALGVSTLCPRHPVPPDQLRLVDAWDRLASAGSSVSVPSVWRLLARWLRCLAWAVRDAITIAWLRHRHAEALGAIRRAPVMVLLKTWCFGPESLAKPGDFYYGTLQAELSRRGVSSVLLCGDSWGALRSAFVRNVFAAPGARRVPELLLIHPWQPIRTAWRQWTTALALRRFAVQGSGRRRAVCAEACLSAVAPIALRNSLQYHIARAAVQTWMPRAYVTFYEGQPWEVPAWLGARSVGAQDGAPSRHHPRWRGSPDERGLVGAPRRHNPRWRGSPDGRRPIGAPSRHDPRWRGSPDGRRPVRANCLTIGYQHTIMMPYSFALLSPSTNSQEQATPDLVLCVGSVTQAMIARARPEYAERVLAFGSVRRASDRARQAPHPARRTVLVLPEGNLPESQVLFQFAMRLAQSAPDHHVIFRCHPLFPFERVRPYLDQNPDRFANIHLSTEPIDADFARASVVLYRGSSSVLYAVLRGLKPLYLHDPRYPDIDPLFEIDTWREGVASVEEAAEALRAYAVLPETNAQAVWQPVADYVDAYTIPITEQSIDALLDALGLTGRRIAQPAADRESVCTS